MSAESKTAATDLPGILKETEGKMRKAVESIQRELASIRTGRANPALLEGLKVDYYGAATPLKQIASINAPDPRMLVIQPWDPNALPEIERAIQKSDLGLTPLNDGKHIRITVPPLSSERREELIKLAHKQAEEGRISVRTIRHGAKEAIEKLHKDKSITEDEKFKGIDDLQKLTDRHHKMIDETAEAKEKDLRTV